MKSARYSQSHVLVMVAQEEAAVVMTVVMTVVTTTATATEIRAKHQWEQSLEESLAVWQALLSSEQQPGSSSEDDASHKKSPGKSCFQYKTMSSRHRPCMRPNCRAIVHHLSLQIHECRLRECQLSAR